MVSKTTINVLSVYGAVCIVLGTILAGVAVRGSPALILGVAGYGLMLALQLLIQVYGIYCASVADAPTNMCGTYSVALTVVMFITYTLFPVLTSVSLYNSMRPMSAKL